MPFCVAVSSVQDCKWRSWWLACLSVSSIAYQQLCLSRGVEGFFFDFFFLFFFSVSKKINSMVFVCATLIDVYM